METMTTIGLDLAKSVFQVHAITQDGRVIVRRALRRSQVLDFRRGLQSCLVGLEACASAHHWANAIGQWDIGSRPASPRLRHNPSVACPDWIYNNRNRIERMWARLKEWRVVGTRYEKSASSLFGVLCLAAAFNWIRR